MFHRTPRRPSMLAQLPIVEFEDAMEDSPQIRATFKEHEDENARFEKYLGLVSQQAKAAAQAGAAYLTKQEELTESFASMEIGYNQVEISEDDSVVQSGIQASAFLSPSAAVRSPCCALATRAAASSLCFPCCPTVALLHCGNQCDGHLSVCPRATSRCPVVPPAVSSLLRQMHTLQADMLQQMLDSLQAHVENLRVQQVNPTNECRRA